MLALEVEFLTGVCFAARPEGSASEQPDWPPQPDRLFSALVSAWGYRGERPNERSALEWLERQQPPRIEASAAATRFVATSYVPPNDPSRKLEALPDRRRRQARKFPAAIPHHPVVRFEWPTEPPDEPVFEALQSLAQDAAYLGHSASLVRCRFTKNAQPAEAAKVPLRRIYPGRLQALEYAYSAGRRPIPGQFVYPEDVLHPGKAEGMFSTNWIVLEDDGGARPDLRATAVVARQMREALLSQYGSEPIPEFVSGHQSDGRPSTAPHLAIVPLADVGWNYSVGEFMGLGLILPRGQDRQRLQAESDWLGGLDGNPDLKRWGMFGRALSHTTTLRLGSLGVWNLARVEGPTKRSLRSERYTQPARRWSTVTPVVLDRYPKSKSAEERENEIQSIVAASCENIGLPRPTVVRIYKHSAVKGAPSAYPSGNAPKWAGWTLPAFLARRMLVHAVIDFAEPVPGPVLLGAGRFSGLGLCMRVEG